MNIIDTMRGEAATYTHIGHAGTAHVFNTLADRLAASGALVPVPGVCQLTEETANDIYAEIDGTIVRLVPLAEAEI